MASCCSLCFLSASSVACRASSLLLMASRELFHLCTSCFFSKWIVSISRLASFRAS